MDVFKKSQQFSKALTAIYGDIGNNHIQHRRFWKAIEFIDELFCVLLL